MSYGEVHLLDTCVFVACGRADNPKFKALAATAEKRGTEFLVTPRVYDELGGDARTRSYPTGSLPIDQAIQDGWVSVTSRPDYTNSKVSNVMDDARRFIAEETDRPEDVVEKADTSLVGISVQLLDTRRADRVSLYTGDKPAGKAAERLVPRYGFDPDQIEWIDGNEFVDRLDENH